MLSFTEMPNGCQIVNSHAPNRDGYIRISIGNPNNSKMYMVHRAIYEAKYGELQEGYEIDHLCQCRQCANPLHLVAKHRTQHLIETNRNRANSRKMEARLIWEESDREIEGSQLAIKMKVSFGSGCRWIRAWKKEIVINGK